MRFLFALLLTIGLCPAQRPQDRVQRILESSNAGHTTFWGIQVTELERDTTLVRLNAALHFVPASNTKLFTTALALMRLGPDHRFQTRVVAARKPDAAGRISGDLRLIGGGDPMLSARAVPYQKGPVTGNPLQAIEALADQVVSCGVRRIDGDIVGDDTAYVWAPYPDGWAQDDGLWEYGAPVSALTVNDNAITLTLRPPADAGLPVSLSFSPALEYYSVDNRIRVARGVERRIVLDRMPGSRQLRLWGTMPPDSPGRQILLAIDDPALYAAYALKDALTRRGVAIAGRPVARHHFPNEAGDLRSGTAPPAPAGGVELACRTSPPLVELLRIIDKVSQNLHAELALREVGRVRRNIGSREAGLEEMREFLAEAGVDKKAFNLEDGSGLSRLNLITPATAVKLLTHMYRSPYRESWISLLPLGGEDGTLSTRFSGNPEARRIRAKTGSLSHVSALSGYIESKSRGTLAFSILANNYNAPASEIRTIIDKICMLLAE